MIKNAVQRLRYVAFMTISHKAAVLDYGEAHDKFSLLRELTKFYRDKNLTEKYMASKEELLSMMPEVKFDDYIAEQMARDLQRL